MKNELIRKHVFICKHAFIYKASLYKTKESLFSSIQIIVGLIDSTELNHQRTVYQVYQLQNKLNSVMCSSEDGNSVIIQVESVNIDSV